MEEIGTEAPVSSVANQSILAQELILHIRFEKNDGAGIQERNNFS